MHLDLPGGPWLPAPLERAVDSAAARLHAAFTAVSSGNMLSSSAGAMADYDPKLENQVRRGGGRALALATGARGY